MTLHISEDFAACLVTREVVTVILNTMPPRDPNDDDDEDEDDEEDEHRDDEPAVVRGTRPCGPLTGFGGRVIRSRRRVWRL